jgi:hypothetical protein
MSFNVRLSLRLFAGIFFVAVFSATAFAAGSADRTQFGRNISIGPGEEVSDVTCFGCSVRVRGHVTSDVTVFAGSIIVEDGGEVSGDVTDFGSGIRLGKDAKVSGDVAAFGGPVRRDTAASVGGDVTNFSSSIWLLLIFGLPLVILGAIVALIIWLVRRFMRPAMPVTA